MVGNLQCLGEEVDPNILLLPRFFRLHKASHLEFECSLCQEPVTKVLTRMMGVKSGNIPKDEPIESQHSKNISKSIDNFWEEIKDLNASYSDTSLDGGGFSFSLLGMIKV